MITDEVIQETINYDNNESLKVEFKDVKRYKSDYDEAYDEAYVKLRILAQSSNTDLTNAENTRKHFVLLSKRCKAKIMQRIKPTLVAKVSRDHLKIKRIEIPVFDRNESGAVSSLNHVIAAIVPPVHTENPLAINSSTMIRVFWIFTPSSIESGALSSSSHA